MITTTPPREARYAGLLRLGGGDRPRPIFATRLLREAGADLVTVAALLGHELVATTAIYTQPGETIWRRRWGG